MLEMYGPTPEKISSLLTLINRAGSVVIVSHHHPDGDAAGSTTALMHFINSKHPGKAKVILPTELPESLEFLLGPDVSIAAYDKEAAIGAIGSCDLLICMDFNSFSRADFLQDALRSSTVRKVLIDHHLNPSADDFELVFSEILTSSTCELLFDMLMMVPGIDGDAKMLPAASATALMTGMTTDTNNFANSVFPGTLRMASALLEAGVDRDDIIDRIFNCYKENRYRAMGWMLSENMKITSCGVAYMVIRSAQKQQFELLEGDTESFVNIPLGIKTIRMTLLLKEDDGFFRVSIRSKKGVSANTLARECFNGGGHEQAAGGRLYWPQDIQSPEFAEDYIEKVTARFMQNGVPGKQK